MMGAKRVHRRQGPSLSPDSKNRVDFILYQIGRDRKALKPGFNTIDVEEAWLYVICDKLKVRSVPGEKVDSREAEYESHIPKMVLMCTVLRSDPSCDFGCKMGISRVCVRKVVQRTTARHEKSKRGRVVWSASLWTANTKYCEYNHLPAFKEKMSCLKSGTVVLQRDGASTPTGKDTEEKLSRAGKEGGWDVLFVMQLAQSSNLTVDDLGFLASLKGRVWRERFGLIDTHVVKSRFPTAEEAGFPNLG